MEKNPLRNNLLTFDEIMIINAIAILHANNEDIMTALQLDMWLEDYMENKVVDGKMKTAKYPMILYNLSCWFYDQQCYKEAVKIADTGIDFCVKYGNLAAFPRLVLNKGVSLAECGEIDKAQKYLHQAIIIFEAMQRIDTVQLINTWCKDHYQLEV